MKISPRPWTVEKSVEQPGPSGYSDIYILDARGDVVCDMCVLTGDGAWPHENAEENAELIVAAVNRVFREHCS